MKLKVLNNTNILNINMALAIGTGDFNYLDSEIGKFAPDELIICKQIIIPVAKDTEIEIKNWQLNEENQTIRFKANLKELYSLGSNRIDNTWYEINKNECVILD